MKKKFIGIIGTGNISQQYVDIFKKIGIKIDIVCARNKKKLKVFSLKNKIPKYTNNINNILSEKLDGLVVCVSPESSLLVAKKILNFKGKILFEKPVGLNYKESSLIYKIQKHKNSFFVALNRRYYRSVLDSKNFLNRSKEKKFISITDQENTLKAKELGHHKLTIKNWMFANSVHLVDLINFYIKSKINKIEKKTKFYNSSKIYFSKIYFKNGDIVEFNSFWNRPAPWKIDISLKDNFIQLKPIEAVKYLNSNRRELSQNKLDKKDRDFKPGFYRQCEDFKKEMYNKKNNLVNLKEYINTVSLVEKLFFN